MAATQGRPLAAKAALLVPPLLTSPQCPLEGAHAAKSETVTGTASVIKADRIDIHGSRIRLQAVDAIETRQRCVLPGGKEWRCGADAANALARKIGSAPVGCRVSSKDR